MESSYIYLFIVILIFYEKSVTASPLALSNILTEDILTLYSMNDLQFICTKDIIKQEVPCGSFLTFIDRNINGDRLIQQLSIDNCYNFIVRSSESQQWLLKSKAYIILLNNISDFAEEFDKLSKDFSWTPTAKFFIILHLKNEEYLKVFTVLSKLNIYHVNIITTLPTDETYVYTYNPFLNNSCGHVNKENVKIFSCREIKKNEIHSNEIENLMRNCPITVVAIENPPNVIFKSNKYVHYRGSILTGIEQFMLNNIAKMENYKLQYIESKPRNEFEFIMDNCTTTSALGYLGNHTLGVSIRGYVLTKKRSECFDFIWGYCYVNFNVYTSLPEMKTWRKVYQVFGTTTWALIAVSYCAVAFSSFIIYNMLVGKINKWNLGLKIWGYLNNHSDQHLIKIGKLKIVMITWILFTFLIISIYETAFFGLITAPDKKGLFVKPDKLFTSSLKPCISFRIRAWFKDTFNLTLSTQIEDECLHDATALEAVAENHELYTLVTDPTFYKREYKYLDNLGHPQLDRWLFRKGDFIFTAFVNRGFPLLEKFQRYALYHFESGLLLKHTADTYHQFTVITKFNPFQLRDFRIHFAILFLGYIISIIIYIVEINQVRQVGKQQQTSRNIPT